MVRGATAGHLRAARALMRWSAEDLAETVGVAAGAIRRFECAEGPLSSPRAGAVQALRDAFEAAGVSFIDPPAGEGVKRR